MKKPSSAPQRKAPGYADGGRVSGNSGARTMRTGIPDSPVELARRSNGVPGFKRGGGVK